jgi:carboxymethylenebutenolidase
MELMNEWVSYDGPAVFYGASPSAERVASIGCPLRGFYGQDDPRIVGGLPNFEAALREADAGSVA